MRTKSKFRDYGLSLLAAGAALLSVMTSAQAADKKSNTTAFARSADSLYKFERGFPTAETIQNAYDAADLRRAIEDITPGK